MYNHNTPWGYFKVPSPRRQKITSEQRQEIRYRRFEGETAQVLALEYGITAGYIYDFLTPMERP